MKRALKLSNLHHPEQDMLVIPFSGGTPSGDATGTTLHNTDFSDTYQGLYVA